MKEKDKQNYLERYRQAKEKGIPFYPDILFKDAVVSLIVFLVLIALAYFVGAPLEERADPADSTYTPKPEWYFLFLFQMLKYFPGEAEVVGIVIIPSLAIITLFLLPLLDRGPRRHFTSRLWVTGVTSLIAIGVVGLTYMSIMEAPPPAEASQGDRTAALYVKNCAGCHGTTITVPPGTSLHDIIAQGTHEGMPAWSADLTTDEIDALAGFVLSPGGNELFSEQCGSCHDAVDLVASNPIELKNSLETGSGYSAHTEAAIPEWTEVMSQEERTTLLNFLIAPDGQRLFVLNCSACHGLAVAFSGSEAELFDIISQGGLHLEMPPWREKLSTSDLDVLAEYVSDPASTPAGESLFEQYCVNCHGERIPVMADVNQAIEAIASGGGHETMPVWGDVLTSSQLEALVKYTMDSTSGTSLEAGRQLFADNCALCHGDFGEGGPNPARADDVIAPISTGEYLKTRDDHTLFEVIAQGQPNFGMSPFGSAYGGPLDDDEVNSIVQYMRSWEADPPVELPPEVAVAEGVSLSGGEIFSALCVQCHFIDGTGGIGPSLGDEEFQKTTSDEDIYDAVYSGTADTPMIAWGEILTEQQIQQLVDYIRELASLDGQEQTPKTSSVSYSADIVPLFEAECVVCHGTFGGWDASSYDDVINSGDHAPVVIAGDAENSLLAQKMLGTHTEGGIMPPAGKLAQDDIQLILDWIAAGALDD